MRVPTRLKATYVGVAALDTALSMSTRPVAHKARFLTKPLLMPLLSASLATAPGWSAARPAVLTAQVGGWVGDVGLLSEEKRPFVIGTAGFAAGHAAYLAAFVPRRRRRPELLRFRQPRRDAQERTTTARVQYGTRSPPGNWTGDIAGPALTMPTRTSFLRVDRYRRSETGTRRMERAAPQFWITSSVRRFLALPAALSLSAIGLDSP